MPIQHLRLLQEVRVVYMGLEFVGGIIMNGTLGGGEEQEPAADSGLLPDTE